MSSDSESEEWEDVDHRGITTEGARRLGLQGSTHHARAIRACLLCAALLGCLIAALLLMIPVGTALPSGYCQEVAIPLKAPYAASGDIESWARGLVSHLDLLEKHRLARGFGWWGWVQLEGHYVGNILAIPRLGLPSIRMQDAAQGFRTTDMRMVGQVTAWPCALALAATWDPNATWRWAKAIGSEFAVKGANMMLGPSVNVHRVARSGRNAEYISGEDPFLGAALAAAYVRGMQEGAGVAAVVKHFVLNQQETARTSMDSRADERTLWEHYYPPFEAAIKASVAAVMCSYNFVNGSQACENSDTLTHDLKGIMGFKGWVMSDWWALQSTNAARAGTDMDMPGTDSFFSGSVLSDLPEKHIEDMAVRVLHGMAQAGALTSPAAQACRVGCDCAKLLYQVKATSDDHSILARQLATEAAVLLRNEPLKSSEPELKTLPLQRGQTIAVLGSACAAKSVQNVGDWTAADYYVVGGSGRVLSRHSVSVLEGLQRHDLQLVVRTNDNLAEVKAALKGADVAILCGGATSSESFDRRTLALDQEAFLMDALDAVRAAGVPGIVVALAPGVITTPWRDKSSAVLLLLLSGQEAGHAVANVLMGISGPTGRLPITLPVHEADTIQPCTGSNQCEYTEGLLGGWHVYDEKAVAFPFGHGLSYTNFEFTAASIVGLLDGPDLYKLTLQIRNAGSRSGVAVPQLYVHFPITTANMDKEPSLRLRGFAKTPQLAPGEIYESEFTLSARDLSVWNVSLRSWSLLVGRFVAAFGASSRDLRLCGTFGVVQEPMRSCSGFDL